MFSFYDSIGRSLAESLGIDSILQILDQVVFRAFFAVVLSFLFVIACGPATIRFLIRKKIGDTGITDAVGLQDVATKKKNTPTMGGALIAAAILFGTVMMADLTNFYILLGIIVMLWLAALGGVDDYFKLTAATRQGGRQGLYGWEKLVFQFGLGLLVCWFCYNHGDTGKGTDMAHALNVPMQKTYKTVLGDPSEALVYMPRIAFVVIGMLMITGLSNAANITDGMDGLASGVSSAVALGLLVLTLIAGKDTWAYYLLVPHVPGSGELAVIAGSMAGACLGFLWFNCSPADMFMGDTGSLALGGLIGYIATVVRQEILVLFMCGVFLIEIVSVIMQVGYFKATGGKRIFRCAPYHHHLHQGGWQEQRVVVRAWIVSVLLVVLALAMIKLR